MVDRAVVLLEPDRSVGGQHGVGQVAVPGLDDGKLPDAIEQRRVVGDPFGHVLADPLAQLPAARREDLLEQVVATDRLDGREQPGRQAVVVRWEEVLGIGRDVVEVARASHAVADGLAADQPGRLERSKLLEDAGPAGTESGGQLIG